MEEIELAKNGLGLHDHQDCFFRGHPDSSFKLLPSLFRLENPASGNKWNLERRAFFQFRTLARKLYEVDHSDWDVLFHMQHHGVPTRLLDWTSVFGVALYFALLDYKEHSDKIPCVWLLNPYALNKKTWNVYNLINPKYLAREEQNNRSFEYGELLLKTRPIGWNTPLAIYESQRSERMFAQSGWFTIHGTNELPMEEMDGMGNGVIKKVDVPIGIIPTAREFLLFAGIGHQQLFPDLDGLAKSVCEKYGLRR